MKNLFIVSLFVLSACGIDGSSLPVEGIYDLTTNEITDDNPVGCANDSLAAPMTIKIVKGYSVYSRSSEKVYKLYICGPLHSDCDLYMHEYATSQDGYYFTIAEMFSGNFHIFYNTIGNHTTINGTGSTTWMTCTWSTSFEGANRY